MEEVQNRQERLQKYNGGGSVETGHFHFGENRTFLFWLDRGAISRVEHENGSFEYVVDDNLCIGCGFCAGICPCGVWEMEEIV